MRLSEPRVAPLEEEDLTGEAKELLSGMRRPAGKPLAIFRTLAHHPKLLKRWLVFGSHILAKNSVAPREREIAILRVGYLCQAIYEWTQHVAIGKEAGLSDAEIRRIAEGPDAEGWSELDAAILRAADELHADSMISDPTWKTLSSHYDTQQCMDLVFTVGQYHLVSMALNTFGVQPEDAAAGFPR